MNGEGRPGEGRPTHGLGQDVAPTEYGPDPVQTTIFDLPSAGKVRRTDPVSSVAAARRTKAPQQEMAILWALSGTWGTQTGDDLADITGIRVDIVRTRLPQMRKKGYCYVDGTGPARGARNSVVQAWRITAAGRDVLREKAS